MKPPFNIVIAPNIMVHVIKCGWMNRNTELSLSSKSLNTLFCDCLRARNSKWKKFEHRTYVMCIRMDYFCSLHCASYNHCVVNKLSLNSYTSTVCVKCRTVAKWCSRVSWKWCGFTKFVTMPNQIIYATQCWSYTLIKYTMFVRNKRNQNGFD